MESASTPGRGHVSARGGPAAALDLAVHVGPVGPQGLEGDAGQLALVALAQSGRLQRVLALGGLGPLGLGSGIALEGGRGRSEPAGSG
ncbi:MAG: hypothetical protein F4Y47_20095 [Acidobacteriia bacterium]|nr:hypothetical protein [Terriglobia bacterium]MYG02551.1 hypothetical protein [Terriglobia bacterium]MYK08038.1 hypothetical protein [Terriglobia bacterium]